MVWLLTVLFSPHHGVRLCPGMTAVAEKWSGPCCTAEPRFCEHGAQPAAALPARGTLHAPQGAAHSDNLPVCPAPLSLRTFSVQRLLLFKEVIPLRFGYWCLKGIRDPENLMLCFCLLFFRCFSASWERAQCTTEIVTFKGKAGS